MGPFNLKKLLSSFCCTKTDKVANCILNKEWKWPTNRKSSVEVRLLKESTPTTFLPRSDLEDQPMPSKWYIHYCICNEEIEKRRLNTKNRLQSWGVHLNNSVREFCQELDENMEHHFFGCRITRQIWNKLQAMCFTYRGCYDLDDEIKWLCRHWSSKNSGNQFKRLVLAATVYTIWRFRNEAIFKGRRITAVGVIAAVMYSVKYTVVSWGKIPRIRENLELVLDWEIQLHCLE
ncbi:hypothetical protein ACH5RR_035341 [Cinchona calisaya]|uniref:Reverse transcriptase zinc-binding domain-containing protein n=1 Tax=Cinchona calisaya TaxID=153742 RepID=A0ABD2YH16_9GENT